MTIYPNKSEVIFNMFYSKEESPISDYYDNNDIVEILGEDLNNGNSFAWFQVQMFAEWGGISGVVVKLNCCSYENEDEFLTDRYEELENKAYDKLCKKIDAIAKSI
jgi:hypothetical protein